MVGEVRWTWAVALLTGIIVVAGACRSVARSEALDVSVERSDAELRRVLGFGPAPAGWMNEIDSVGRRLADGLAPTAAEVQKIAAIAKWLNSPAGVRPELVPNDSDLVPSLAWERHRGGCTALVWIWTRLGRAMDLELEPVLLPGHVVLRTGEGRFVETLRGGMERSRAFYDSAFSLAKRPAYRLDAARVPVLEASLLVHLGLLHWKGQDLANAESCFRRASAIVPGMPEAEGNLGLALEAQGDLPGAREHLGIALAGDSLNDKASVRWEVLSKGGSGP